MYKIINNFLDDVFKYDYGSYQFIHNDLLENIPMTDSLGRVDLYYHHTPIGEILVCVRDNVFRLYGDMIFATNK